MASIRRSKPARKDLDAIWDYVATQGSIAHAEQLLRQIDAKIHVLGHRPFLGYPREDLAPDLRQFPVGNYLIFYRPVSSGIEVVRVLHGHRDLVGLFAHRR